MTRKHFNAIAASLARTRPDPTVVASTPEAVARYMGRYFQWLEDCEHIADACQMENVRFDRARFLEACGVET